ncbi:MAG: protelomerase family protein [Cyanobacteria bacterium P01_A01_bin.45]
MAFNYLHLTKKELIQICKERKLPRYSVVAKQHGKEPLIQLIQENDQENDKQKQPETMNTTTQTVETIELKLQENIPTPEEFFNVVKDIDNKLEVNRKCNELLDSLKANHTVKTISKMLSAYKKPFYAYTSPHESLNEVVTTKQHGTKSQHIAANLLSLDSEQKTELAIQTEVNEKEKLGFDSEGNVRDIELPPIDIEETIRLALTLLNSNSAYEIACGLLILTGLRQNEIGLDEVVVTNNDTNKEIIIRRDFRIVGENLIAVSGISKKHGSTTYYVRPTLAPAKMILDALNRFRSSSQIQKHWNKMDEKTTKVFNKSPISRGIQRAFQRHFGVTLSSIETFNDSGELIKPNGYAHKARGFYIQAMLPVLKLHNYNQNQSKQYMQLALSHENSKETQKYFDRYDENRFISPIQMNIPKNLNVLGKTNFEDVEKLEIWENKRVGNLEDEKLESEIFYYSKPKEKSNPQLTVDLAQLTLNLQELDNELSNKLNHLLDNGSNLTEALSKVFKQAYETTSQTEKERKITVSDHIENIVQTIMDYNDSQPEIKNWIMPGYSVVDSIWRKVTGKELARATYQKFWYGDKKKDKKDEGKGRDISERIAMKGIPYVDSQLPNSKEIEHNYKKKGVITFSKHNLVNHRGSMNEVLDKIAEMYQETYG